MPVRNSYRPRRRFSRCDHQPQVKSTPPPSLPFGQPIPVPFSSSLTSPIYRSCTAMRQSLIKFNNFCAARALPILRSRPLPLPPPPFPPPPPSPAFLDLLLSSSTSRSCYSISHCPVVYLRSTAASPLSTSLLWSLRHVINLHLSQRNH